MAVIALAGGGPDDRILAREGATWLLRHQNTWVGRVEPDPAAPDANWQHMTSRSACVRS